MKSVKIYSNNAELVNFIKTTIDSNEEYDCELCIYDYDYGDISVIFMPCIVIVHSEQSLIRSDFTYVLLHPFGKTALLRTVDRIFSLNKSNGTHTDNNIKALFAELGFCADRKGTEYLAYAIKLKINGKNGEMPMNTIIRNIARKYNVSENSVERNMRTAIEHLCEYGNLDKIYELFRETINSEKGKPTNSQFISVVAEKCRYSDYTGKNKRGCLIETM